MEKVDLSVIVPFVGEYPQVLFTLQSINQALVNSGITYEVIAIDNHGPEVESQWYNQDYEATRKFMTGISKIMVRDNVSFDFESSKDELIDLYRESWEKAPKCRRENRSGDRIKGTTRGNQWLKYMTFDERLSHWECKRLACEAANSDTFLFIDAHCIMSPGVGDMFRLYDSEYRTKGTLHMPTTYHIMEFHRLTYKLAISDDFWGYSFTGFDLPIDSDVIREVPCMTTDGMMLSREVYNKVGGWPKGMTMWGGGENFMMYAMSACGFGKWMYPKVTLYHHGEQRDYHYVYNGLVWNRMIAHYLFGGVGYAERYLKATRGNQEAFSQLLMMALDDPEYRKHRQIIKDNTTTDLEEWRAKWEAKAK